MTVKTKLLILAGAAIVLVLATRKKTASGGGPVAAAELSPGVWDYWDTETGETVTVEEYYRRGGAPTDSVLF